MRNYPFEESTTCSNGVEQRIIGVKTPGSRAGDSPGGRVRTARAAPAVRNVMVGEDSAGQRLDNFLIKTLKGVPKSHLYRVVRSGEVRVNGGRAGADTRLASGDAVRIPPVRTAAADESPAAPARDFPVVFEDEHLLAIDKPAGVAVHGGSGESFGVIEQLRRARPQAPFLELVHRLDKETSGLLLIAKTRKALVSLQEDLRLRRPERAVGKSYSALVVGDWPEALKVIDQPLQRGVDAQGGRFVRVVDASPAGGGSAGRRSITLVRVVQRFGGGFSLLDVTLKTGRTHQIRVHLAQAGHVIAGDPKYGDFALNRALARGLAVPGVRFDRMFLHARRLGFVHPTTGERMAFEAPLPDACRRLMAALGSA